MQQIGGARLINLLDDIPARIDGEIFTDVFLRHGVRIERIVSTGQSTPADKPHRQGHDEWVLILPGRQVSALRAKVSAIFVPETTF
jgi:cupin 2 domain-containing protein